jgi:hypothetical protein
MDTNNRGFNTEQESSKADNQYYRQNQNMNNNYNQNYMQISSPNSGVILTLGIISVVSTCCFVGIVGLIFSIISLVLVPGAKKAYYAEPELYTKSSFENIKAGQICAIIGLVLNSIFLMYIIIMLLIGDGMGMLNESFNEVWNEIGY